MKLKETVEAAFLFQPHVVVTVDSKGFSFRLLKQLRGNINCTLGVRDQFVVLCNKPVVSRQGNAFCS